MEAKELMIGDWVNLKGCETAQIRDLKDLLNIELGIFVASGVSLTEEILKKNGFAIRYEHWYYKRVRENGVFDVCVSFDYKEIEITKIFGADTDCEETEYGLNIECGEELLVHKFQQILRIYNLNELADNFKI